MGLKRILIGRSNLMTNFSIIYIIDRDDSYYRNRIVVIIGAMEFFMK